jgi:hypothetical protein
LEVRNAVSSEDPSMENYKLQLEKEGQGMMEIQETESQ